jgi:hypothetical protein
MREEHRLRVSGKCENIWIYEKVGEGWRKLFNEEFLNLYSQEMHIKVLSENL